MPVPLIFIFLLARSAGIRPNIALIALPGLTVIAATLVGDTVSVLHVHAPCGLSGWINLAA
jgi:hypothetical protein